VSESLNQQIEQLEAIYKSERDPHGRAFAPLADAHRRRGDLDKALAVLQEGLSDHPDFASGHMVAGWVYRTQRASDNAMRSFELVLTLDGGNSLARAAIAELIDDQRAQDYRDKVAAQKAADSLAAAVAVAEDARPVVPIESLAPVPQMTRAAPVETPADSAQGYPGPLVQISSLAPDADSESTVLAAQLPGPISDHDDRIAVEIGSLAPEIEPVNDGASVPPGVDRDNGPTVPIDSLAPENGPADDGPSVDDDVPRTPPPSRALDHEGERTLAVEAVGEEIYTKTLAELYAGQGATERAIETYRKMLDRDPTNETFRKRVAELELVASGLDAAAVEQAVPIESLAPDKDPEEFQVEKQFQWLDEL
jgi:tetratricopeptide (TPR) repeat protein